MYSLHPYDIEAKAVGRIADISPENVLIVLPYSKLMGVTAPQLANALRYLKHLWNDEGCAVTTLRRFIYQWAVRNDSRAWHKRRINRIKYKLFGRWKKYPDPNYDFHETTRLPNTVIEILCIYFGLRAIPHVNCRCTIIPVQEEAK